MEQTATAGTLTAPVLLGPSRVVSIPGWMKVIAQGAAAGDHALFPLAAVGQQAQGSTGVIAFDVRDHLLLDPDCEDALILTIDLLRRLVAPANPLVSDTGAYTEVAVNQSPVRLTEPDGTTRTLTPDQWGHVRFRPLLAGRYRLLSGTSATAIFANYYDASESNLVNAPSPLPRKPDHASLTRGGGLRSTAIYRAAGRAGPARTARRIIGAGPPRMALGDAPCLIAL